MIISGSTKDAEEYDQLPPEEAKKRLRILVDKMDSDSDGFVDKSEMNAWILKSFASLSKEESEERFEDTDEDGDSIISWDEYKRAEFDLDDDEDFDIKNVAGDPDKAEELSMMEEDHILFQAADKDSDGKLTKSEFLSFTHPEEDAEMIRPVLSLTLKHKDSNQDGKINFQEFIGERAKDQTKEWLLTEKERFDSELDKNKDGFLNEVEIIAWAIPDNNEITTEEVNHLFAGPGISTFPHQKGFFFSVLYFVMREKLFLFCLNNLMLKIH